MLKIQLDHHSSFFQKYHDSFFEVNLQTFSRKKFTIPSKKAQKILSLTILLQQLPVQTILNRNGPVWQDFWSS